MKFNEYKEYLLQRYVKDLKEKKNDVEEHMKPECEVIRNRLRPQMK